eukprot:4159511-Pleurochrysis_carterae.AAC.2
MALALAPARTSDQLRLQTGSAETASAKAFSGARRSSIAMPPAALSTKRGRIARARARQPPRQRARVRTAPPPQVPAPRSRAVTWNSSVLRPPSSFPRRRLRPLTPRAPTASACGARRRRTHAFAAAAAVAAAAAAAHAPKASSPPSLAWPR